MKLNKAIHDVGQGRDLSADETRELFDIIFEGHATHEQIEALLKGLRNKGEAISEIQGAVMSMRAHMKTVPSREGAIDIVGTGGDGHGTFNVSTAAAIVTAGAGVPVAKHGNRAASSLSGSSDVLAKLGVNLEASWDVLEKALDEIGLVFLFAPVHHPAMKHVVEVRRKMGVRTIFNLLGPLTNPAQVKLHVISVYDNAWSRPIAETLKALGSHTAWVTHGHHGLDEITTTGPTQICELKSNNISSFEVTPEDNGFPVATLADIRGGDAQTNADAVRELLDGKKSAYRDIVLMNAGAALLVAGKTNNLKSAIHLAAQAIDNGSAKAKLEQLIKLTNRTA